MEPRSQSGVLLLHRGPSFRRRDHNAAVTFVWFEYGACVGELESFDQALPQAQVQAAGDFRALPRDRIEGTVAQSNGPVLVFEGFISAHMQRIAELFAIDDSLPRRPCAEAASETCRQPARASHARPAFVA